MKNQQHFNNWINSEWFFASQETKHLLQIGWEACLNNQQDLSLQNWLAEDVKEALLEQNRQLEQELAELKEERTKCYVAN